MKIHKYKKGGERERW